ncbi:MAG: APC family permease [Deltaproteobacteria bacterium]|nr:APC family permease [Deltaproteobacteria bacterium]
MTHTAPLLKRSLSTLALVFVMYFSVSGGPFTTEALVSEVGPGMALAVLLFIPLFWSLPETLIIAELSSMFPEEGGYYRWVYRAFGPFWAFQNGYWTWLYSVVDLAIYPVLFNQYLAYFVPGLGDGGRYIVALGIIWGATLVNLRGAMPVGRVSVVSGVFVIAGFTVLALAAIPNMGQNPWHPFTLPASDSALGSLGIGMSIALWNYTGWDNASTVGGEIQDSGRTYPKALAIALPLVIIGYMLPLLTTLSASDWSTWTAGGWPQIAIATAGPLGPWIAVWLAIAGMVSAVALFNALLLSYSRIPLAMSVDGFLPASLVRTDGRGTPTNAVLASGIMYSVCALLPLRKLVVADVLLYGMALFLEFGALVVFRIKTPELRGSYRIPVGLWGVIALAVMPAVVLLCVIGFEIHDGEYGLPAVLASFAAAGVGPVLYLFANRYRLRGIASPEPS